ncbi:MAG: MATE family efflux transporter [Tissierella sp.]|uniref:MATE family efflux transporter n=1 Tax=Tissierella sp. TaxID=41274 RepID=UPI003F954B36
MNIKNKKTFNKVFYKYIITSILGMLMFSIYVLFDTIFVGQALGKVGLAALNVSIPIYNLLFGIGLLIGVGSSILISINVGKDNNKLACIAFNHSIVLGITIGLLISIFGYIFSDNIILFLGAGGENKLLAEEYLRIVIPFSWSFIMVYNLSVVVRNDNNPRLSMIAMTLGGFLNIILDYILIFPFKMGMRGAAIATVISSLVSLSILLKHIFGKNCTYRLNSIKINKNSTIRILKIGFPSFIVELSSGILIYIFNKELIQTLGYIGVSSYTIIANISLMIVAIFNGISQGAQPLLSLNYGLGDIEEVAKIRNKSIKIAFILGIISLLIGELFPEFLISLFTNEKGKIVDITKLGIRIYFLSFPLAGINIVANGYLQSIEISRYATFISILRGVIFNLVGLKLFTIVLGSIGIWITVPITEILILITIGIVLYNNKENVSMEYKNNY